MVLGGLITACVGVGLMIFLYYLPPARSVFLVGLMPLLIGVVLTVWGLIALGRHRRD